MSRIERKLRQLRKDAETSTKHLRKASPRTANLMKIRRIVKTAKIRKDMKIASLTISQKDLNMNCEFYENYENCENSQSCGKNITSHPHLGKASTRTANLTKNATIVNVRKAQTTSSQLFFSVMVEQGNTRARAKVTFRQDTPCEGRWNTPGGGGGGLPYKSDGGARQIF